MSEPERSMQQQRFRSRLTVGVLGVVAFLLGSSVVGAAVWRAYMGERLEPTPTIPAGLEPALDASDSGPAPTATVDEPTP
ncbi:MAG: hypothetical protein ACOC8X_09235, partial [Chloroflexota bacterium]